MTFCLRHIQPKQEGAPTKSIQFQNKWQISLTSMARRAQELEV